MSTASDAIDLGFGAEFPSQHVPAINLECDRIELLSVSPVQADHDTLARVLSPKNWVIEETRNIAHGIARLRQNRFPIVICERDLMPGSWRELLAEAVRLLPPSYLIVTCRLADEELWAEALNLGAYDVLAKPFEAEELVRVISLAWLHWKDRYQLDRVGIGKVMAAAQ